MVFNCDNNHLSKLYSISILTTLLDFLSFNFCLSSSKKFVSISSDSSSVKSPFLINLNKLTEIIFTFLKSLLIYFLMIFSIGIK